MGGQSLQHIAVAAAACLTLERYLGTAGRYPDYLNNCPATATGEKASYVGVSAVQSNGAAAGVKEVLRVQLGRRKSDR